MQDACLFTHFIESGIYNTPQWAIEGKIRITLFLFPEKFEQGLDDSNYTLKLQEIYALIVI